MWVLFLLLLIVPIAELYVIIQVGQAIGALPTIAILILDSMIGAWLLRREGRAAWERFRATVDRGAVPANEAIDGVLVIIGGALLLTPGFLSDLFGITLLLPPTRALVRTIAVRRASWGIAKRTPMGRSAYAAEAVRRSATRRRPADIDTTATEVDPR
ncbi:MAG: FxsA family protein [Baekduia sp.]